MPRNFPPNFFEPLFCGSEKIPQNSRQNSHQISQISLRKIQKNHRRASAGEQGEQTKIPGLCIFSLLNYESESERKSPGFIIYFVSVACCCGLCVPNMITTKANAKEDQGEFICLSVTKANAKRNLQIFICNHFCVDGSQARILGVGVASQQLLRGLESLQSLRQRVGKKAQ